MNSKYICRYRESNTLLVNDRGTLRFLGDINENTYIPYIDELSPICEIQFETKSSYGNTMISNAHLLFECENSIIVFFYNQKIIWHLSQE